jgi:phosphoribosyl-ATP pyrophosphohydrolase
VISHDGPGTNAAIDRLAADLAQALAEPGRFPRTAKLLASGVPHKAKKLVEEAAELAIEAVRGDREAAIREAADLVYNFLVLLDGIGLGVADLSRELDRRRAAYGIAGKEPKAGKAGPLGARPPG